MQTTIADLQARQDSLARATARQNRALQDSLRASSEILRMLRGQITNDIGDLKELVLAMQQLMGQSDQRLAQLREQMEQRERQTQQQQTTSAAASTGTNIDQLYADAMGRLKESPATARILFQQIVTDFREHPRAADAQFYIGETYYEEKNFAQALKEYELVAESFPNSPRAAGALLRAGIVAEERNDRVKARQYYTRVANTYKDSEEAKEANRALQRLRR